MNEEINYNRRFQAGNGKVFDEISAWIGGIAHHVFFDRDYTYQYMNENETEVIRFNRATRVIELSDKVDSFVEDSVKHIIKTEIRSY